MLNSDDKEPDKKKPALISAGFEENITKFTARRSAPAQR